MNIFNKLVASTTLGLAAIASLAFTTPATADDCCWLGEFHAGIGADYLYLTPCVGNLEYAVKNEGARGDFTSFFHSKYIQPGFNSGYRGYAFVDNVYGDIGGKVSYTYLFASKMDATFADAGESIFLVYPGGLPDFDAIGTSADSRWTMRYRTLEGLLGYHINFNESVGSNFSVTLFTGIQGVHVEQHLRSHLYDANDIELIALHTDTEYSGVGSISGLEFKYPLFCGLSWYSMMSGSFIIGDVDSHIDAYTSEATNPGVTATRLLADTDCVCFPGWHMMSGLNYAINTCGMEFDIKVGYEYQAWVNVPVIGLRDTGHDQNFTLWGLYAGAQISF